MNKSNKKKHSLLNQIAKEIQKLDLPRYVNDLYAIYSESLLLDRALPNVFDGLKPVQRRIIYAFYKLKLFHGSVYKKSARMVGEILGKYHPHGDTSVYSAMVRMGQWWKMNYPLIDIQGNSGSIDGDPPAAMRYTEMKLTKIAELLTTKLRFYFPNSFQYNFDDSTIEPIVFHTFLPLLLINGQFGIASGYTTNIPPHNLKEILDALIYLIDNPNTQARNIFKFIKGPDFPTGGWMLKNDNLINEYNNGEGKFKLICKYNLKTLLNKIVLNITSIPYGINKSVFIKQLEIIRIENKNRLIKKILDLSKQKNINIIIELNKNINIELFFQKLVTSTHFVSSFNYQLIAIVNNKLEKLSLLKLLQLHIEHSKYIYLTQAKIELSKLKINISAINALLKIKNDVKEIINLILKSKNKTSAIQEISKKFELNEFNSKLIVNLRLHRLSKDNFDILNNKKIDLLKKIDKWNKIINNENYLLKTIKNKYIEISEFSYPGRKTKIVNSYLPNSNLNKIVSSQDEEIIFYVFTVDGHFYCTSEKLKMNYFSLNILSKLRISSNVINFNLNKKRKEKFVLLFSNGYCIIDDLFQLSSLQEWNHLNKLYKLDLQNDKLILIIPEEQLIKNQFLIIVTKLGQIKLLDAESFSKLPSNYLTKFANLNKYDSIVKLIMIDKTKFYKAKNNYLFLLSNSGHAVYFDIKNISPTLVRTSTILGMKLKINSQIIFAEHNITKCLLINNYFQLKTIAPNKFLVSSRYSIGQCIFNKEQQKDKNTIIFASNISNQEIYINNYISTLIDNKIKILNYQKLQQYLNKWKTEFKISNNKILFTLIE